MAQNMNSLTAGWYNALCQNLSLDPSQFQLAQGGGVPVGSDSKFLWDAIDAVPPVSATNTWQGSRSSFASSYGQILRSLQDPPGSALQKLLGDDYDTWLQYDKTYVRQAGDTYDSILKGWASGLYPPEHVKKLMEAADELGPVAEARDLWDDVGDRGVKAYTPTFEWVHENIRSAPGHSVQYDASAGQSDFSHTWAQTSNEVFGGVFGGVGDATVNRISSAVLAGKVTASCTFGHVLLYTGKPLSTVSKDHDLAAYKPWYDSGIMSDAWANQDNHDELWDPAGGTNWADAFGDKGMLRYVTNGLLLVDGIDMTLTVETSFSQDDLTHVDALVDSGYFPFYFGSHRADVTNEVVRKDASGFTAHTTTVAGSPIILGANVLSAAAAFR